MAHCASRVIDAAPDPQWKLLIALARYGGLRTPSEPLALTWRDVDFEGRRFIIRSSKKEHHAHASLCAAPMRPELAHRFPSHLAPTWLEHPAKIADAFS